MKYLLCSVLTWRLIFSTYKNKHKDKEKYNIKIDRNRQAGLTVVEAELEQSTVS